MPPWPSRLLLALFAVTCFANCSRPSTASLARQPILLAIFAHPDDEASVGPVLAKYAAEGVRVYIAIATDGSLGVSEHAALPAGAEIAAVRARELQCAAEQLGLQPPLMFRLEDQLRMAGGLQAHVEQINELRTRVRQLFTQLRPDAVITWPA
jgi:LmbE family N-acetylglucosaminyl deacetylase